MVEILELISHKIKIHVLSVNIHCPLLSEGVMFGQIISANIFKISFDKIMILRSRV